MENQVRQDDEISFKDVILKLRKGYKYILTKWIIIAFAGAIGGVFGVVYSLVKKPVYTGECTFVLEEENSGGGMGQYSGIASVVGIDLGGSSNGIFQGDNIFELYKSRLMIEKTLLSSFNLKGKNELLIDHYLRINKLREKWKNKPKLYNIRFNIPKKEFTLTHDSIIANVVSDINKNYLVVDKPDQKLSIISVKIKSEDELFAKAFTEKIVENVNFFYIKTKTKMSLQNLFILQRQADSIRNVLNISIGNAASAIDVNPNANSALQVLRVPSQRRQIDVQASTAIYAEIAKQLEIAKITLRKDSPLIQVIDVPVLPLKKEQLGALIGFLIGSTITVFIVIIYLIGRKIINGIIY